MRKTKVRRSKQKKLSSVGEQLANVRDDLNLAFDQIKNVTFMATSDKMWRNDPNLLTYRKLILATRRQKDVMKKRSFIEKFCAPWKNFFAKFRDQIIEEDLSFMVENTIVMTGGRTGQLPISDIYSTWLELEDESDLATFEAYLYHIFKHLVDQKADPEAYQKLREICAQYEVEEDEADKDAINNIVKTVKGSMKGMEGKEPSVDSIAPLVQAIIGNQGMKSSMSSLAENLLSGKTDIPTLVQSVKASVGENAEGDDSEGPPELEEEYTDDSSTFESEEEA